MELGLRRLRILREIADHGGVTAAAEAMQHSPSGISQQMAALEQEIGSAVLERRGRGVQLTDVGRVLLEHAEILLAAEREAQAAIEHARDTVAGELSVGVFSTVAAGLIPAVVADLASHYPEVHLTTREINPDDAVLELRHGHLDVAYLIDYPEAQEPWPASITVVGSGLDRLHLAAPAGQFTAGKVDLSDLAEAQWVMSSSRSYYGRAVRTACRLAGFEIQITHQVDEQATALAMVGAGLGITLMSDLGRTFLPPGVDVLELRRPLHRQLLIGHDAAAGSRPAIAVFLDSAVRAAATAAGTFAAAHPGARTHP